MAMIKEVTGAVLPYALLAGAALVAYKYRDAIWSAISGWITGPVAAAPGKVLDIVTGKDVAYCARFPNAIQCIIKRALAPTPPPGASPADIKALVESTWWIPTLAPVAPVPSPLAVSLGLAGDPIAGYTSVMAPIAAPAPVVNPYGYPLGVHMCDGIRITIAKDYYDVSRRDDRYIGIDPSTGHLQTEGWASVLFGAGPATWYNPALKSYMLGCGL